MGVCKFFIQGYCKFGDRCHFDHPRGNSGRGYSTGDNYDLRSLISGRDQGSYNNRNDYRSNQYSQREYNSYQHGGSKYEKNTYQERQNRFAALSDTVGSTRPTSFGGESSNPSAREVMDSMANDMKEWQGSKSMWKFSCYAFSKDIECMPGLEDISPEEMRFKAYGAQGTGNATTFAQWYNQMVNDYTDKRQELMNPNVQVKSRLYDVIDTILKASSSKSSMRSSSTDAFRSKISPHSVFGNPSNNTAMSGTAFGGTVFDNSNANNSAATGGGFGSSSVTAGSVFGGSPQATPGGIFGSSNTQSSVPSLFSSGPAPTGLFGKPATTVPSLFTTTTVNQFPSNPTQLTEPTNQTSSFQTQPTNQTSPFSSTPFQQQNTTQNNANFSQFGKNAQSSTTDINSASSTQSLFVGGTAAPTVSTSQTVSSGFSSGSSVDVNRTSSGATSGQSTKISQYTPIDQLTAEERTAFEAHKFVLGKIPTRPPPRELI